MILFLSLLCPSVAAATRLITTTKLSGVSPERALAYLGTPTNWPDLVLSSWSVRGDGVEKPFQPGQTVEEIFGLPPILPLEVSWTCTVADATTLVFDSPAGLAGVAENCKMEFDVQSDNAGGCAVELAMSYDALSPLAVVAQPALVLDNAIALKVNLPSKLMPLGSTDPIAGPLVAMARRTGVLPEAEADGWTGEPTQWAEADSMAQQLSEVSQKFLGGFKQWAAEAVAGDFDQASVDATLSTEIGNGGVVVFAFASCPFCKKARELLDGKGAAYTWVLLDEREDGAALRARLGARTGRTSLPSVWMAGDYCGGLNDGLGEDAPGLTPLEQRGELDGRLRVAGAMA